MRGTNRYLVVVALLAALQGAIAHAADDPKGRRLTIRKDGELYRGTDPARVRAIETQQLFRPGATEEDMVKTYIAISDVGATGIWFDLTGVSADGSFIDPVVVQHIAAMKDGAMYRYIAPIMRLFGPDAPKDKDYRVKVAQAVANAFKGQFGMVYWVEGPGTDEVTKTIHDGDSRLLVAAPMGGDIDVVSAADEAKKGRPTLVIGAIPDEAALHCLMPAGDATYRAFETANTDMKELNAPAPNTSGLAQSEVADGFVSLFNGRDLDQWVITGRDQSGWAIEGGELRWQHRGGGVVRSVRRYDDFVLKFEYRLFVEGANSGVFIHAPRANRQSKMGFEFQTMGDAGKVPDDETTGAIYVVVPPLVNASRPVGEWNQVELRLEGPKYHAELNGQVVQDINFDDNPELKYRLRRGFIGLQDHSNEVAFRNIRIKEL
ncbi:MAG: DUF1080 domain-containing protein [Candidatus Hydrogenedentota bacterium]